MTWGGMIYILVSAIFMMMAAGHLFLMWLIWQLLKTIAKGMGL